MKLRTSLPAWVVAAVLLVGCNDFEFGTSVVGGDASDDLLQRFDVTDGDGAIDAPDHGDARDDVMTDDADVPDDGDVGDLGDGGDARDVGDVSDGPGACRSDADCTTTALPACDTASGRCVACTVTNDRCPRGQYCNPTTLSCAAGCRSDDDCILPMSGDGGADVRFCDVGRRVCVECRRDAECPSGQFCAGGECAASCSSTRRCPTGQTCCGAACVDTTDNGSNCGACGVSCALANAAAVCRASACVVGTCIEPFGNCDGRASNGCEADLRTTTNCGACDRACPVRPNATATCDATRRSCGFTCAPGFADCNGRPEDGCEASLATDDEHCNGCGNVCALARATPACAAGRCIVGACNPGWGNCDGVDSNGCETNVRISPSHCGTCARACPVRANATATCDEGTCRSTCAPGSADCDGNAANGCEVNVGTDLLNCGACGSLCRPANATANCLLGVCSVGACNTSFGDCDGSASNGCEVDLRTSVRNCGGCGISCGSGQVCLAGACVVDCGALTRCGGSCADVQTDPANCGRCGTVCPGSQQCVSGACRLVCAAPQVNCAGACVVTSTNRSHCGGCGNVCPTRANAAPTCSGGVCGSACNAGFADCDGNAANGCEANTATDARNCGGCSVQCSFVNASATCAAGRCALGACTIGFGDCDMNPANGCEAVLATDARNCGRCGTVCPTTCSGGTCAPAVTIDRPTVINTLAAPVAGMAGTRSAMLVGVTGMTIAPGTRVILHQSQGSASSAGNYEFNRVVASAGPSLMLETNLRFSYATASGSRAQIVAVAVYDNLFVGPTGQLTAPEWNGSTGGILAVEATGSVTVQGGVTMNGRGFRGNTRVCSSVHLANNCQAGVQGESWSGVGRSSVSANAGGGGGGGPGQDCGAGGGGAYGTGATNGSTGDCNGKSTGLCATRCPNEGGALGMIYGATSPANTLHIGSAGGEGGLDEDGGLPGVAGNGAGIIFLRVGGTLTVTGVVSANGVDGLNGNQFACAGTGCGMGGGGGGSGGAVRIVAARAVLGAGLVTATGGVGGQCSCRTVNIRRAYPAGTGGNGRIFVSAPMLMGTTTPPLDAQ